MSRCGGSRTPCRRSCVGPSMRAGLGADTACPSPWRLCNARSAFAGRSRLRLQQPASARSCSKSRVAAVPRRPCTAPLHPLCPGQHSTTSFESSPSAASLRAACERSVLARTPPPHKATLEERALHRIRVQELIRQAKQSRSRGSCSLQRRAEDRALHEFLDPRARARPCSIHPSRAEAI